MKKLLFISILMAIFCACSNDFDSIEESDSSIKKKTELMDSGILAIDFEAEYSTSPYYYYAVVEVKVRMTNKSGQQFYPLNEVVTLCGATPVLTTELEYFFPVSASGWTPEIKILRILDINGNIISVPGNEKFWLFSSSAEEYDTVEIRIGETYSTHCLSPNIGIALTSQR